MSFLYKKIIWKFISDFDRQRSPVQSRSRSRSPHRLSSADNDTQPSPRYSNRTPSRSHNNNNANRFDDRRNNRYRSTNSNNFHGNNFRNSGNDRLEDTVNLYSDRELGLKYRYGIEDHWRKVLFFFVLLFLMQMGKDSSCLKYSLWNAMGCTERFISNRRFDR